MPTYLNDEIELATNTPNDHRLKKRWGIVSALPSEFLIHFRKGRMRKNSTGQGASCFKLLKDTVFIIPTSLKEITFQSYQLTQDNVDVRIRGIAVYRISDPLRIFKLINFSNRQAAEKKLARMIGDMCRSTAKWQVANMGVEECIRKRKEEIADSLKREISRVVADPDTGWGIDIVTIDIQDVYIQDEEIFNAIQMKFKSAKMRESEQAQLEMKNSLEMRALQMEEALANQRKSNELHKAKIDAEIKEEQVRLARKMDEKQFELSKFRKEQEEGIANYSLEQEIQREKQSMLLEFEKTQKQVEACKLVNEEEITAMRSRIEVENSADPASLERNFMEKALPEIAHAMCESMGQVKMHVYQQEGRGGGSPFRFIMDEVMEILRDRMEAIPRAKDNAKPITKRGDEEEPPLRPADSPAPEEDV